MTSKKDYGIGKRIATVIVHHADGHETTRQATVGRQVPKTGGQGTHSDPEVTLTAATEPSAVTDTYIAPDHPALNERILRNGEVTTWGGALNSMQPTGLHHGLFGAGKRKTWGALYPDGDGSAMIIPASVAKASGLPDLTTPLESAEYDLELANREYDRVAYTDGWDPRRDEKASAAAARVRQLKREIIDIQKDEHRDEVMAMSYTEAWGLIDGDPLSDPHRNKPHYAELLAEHPHIYVVRSVAASERWRNRLGSQARESMLTHRDETVRLNFVTRLTGTDIRRVYDVVENDASQAVSKAASESLKSMGYVATRTSPNEVRFDRA
jgi:hypothetical protein